MINLSSIIEKRLSVLKNMQVNYIGRCLDMGCFGYGKDIPYEDIITGEARMVSEYTLHIQCAFRVIQAEKILFTNLDMYTVNSSIQWTEDFDYNVPGANLYDEQVKEWSKRLTDVIVTDIQANEYGDLRINMSNNSMLEVYINRSSADECWRFFSHHIRGEHFVITGQGIEK